MNIEKKSSSENGGESNRDLQARLQKELAELESLRDDAQGWTAPVELDQQSVGRVSRIDAMQMQAMSRSMQHRREIRLALLRMALKRFEDGEFGVCLECGEPIPAARLNIDPAFARCVRCEK